MKNAYTLSPILWREMWELPRPSGTVWLAAEIIANDGEDITSARLADQSGYSIETIKRCLRVLVDKNILKSEVRRHRGRILGTFYLLSGRHS